MNVLQLMIYISHQKIERIDEYLQLGGLFNPELANHQAVRNLIIDCRDLIKDLIKQIEDSDKMLFNQSQTIREQHEINERCNQTIRELRLVNIMEDKVARVASVKCKVSEPYVERAPAGDFTWYVYNKNSGHIVASTYDRQMAEAILTGIGISDFYHEPYAICEKYRGPEPMV